MEKFESFLLLAPFFSEAADGHHGAYPPAISQAAQDLGLQTIILSNQTRILRQEGTPRIGYASVRGGKRIVNVAVLFYLIFRVRRKTLVYLQEGSAHTLSMLCAALVNRNLSLVVNLLYRPNFELSKIEIEKINQLIKDGRLRVYADGPVITSEYRSLGLEVLCLPSFSLAPEDSSRRSRDEFHGKVLIVTRFEETVREFMRVEAQLCRQCKYFIHPPSNLVGRYKYLFTQESKRNLSQVEYFSYLASFDRVLISYPKSFVNVSAKAIDCLRLGIPLVLEEETASSIQLAEFGGYASMEFANPHSAIQALSLHVDLDLARKKVPSSVGEFVESMLRDQIASSHSFPGLTLIALLPVRWAAWFVDALSSKLRRTIKLMN